MPKFKDLTTKKFGTLTPITIDRERTKDGRTYWLCNCDCGTKDFSIEAYNLKRAKFPNCGCKSRELRSKSKSKTNVYDLSGEYGIGWTSNTNKEFYFDLEDYDKIKDYCWFENKQDGYIRRPRKTNNIGSVFLHNVVLNSEKSDSENRVDHIDKNRNNCRKYNLRKCTHHQNNMNKGLDNRNKSGVSGVRWINKSKGWNAYIIHNYEQYNLGVYSDFKDAVKVRLLEEIKYCREYAPQQHLWEELGIVNDGIYPEKKTKCKKVLCLENGIIYNSCKECAEKLGIRAGDIARCARNERSHTHNYHFKYL